MLKRNVKRIIPILIILLGSVVFTFIFSYVGFESDGIQQTTNKKVVKMKYALVNEDRGATFEEKNCSLGNDFVTLINQDVTNQWETTTRDMASRGIEDGQFDAQIISPQEFSEKLLYLL